MLLSHSTFRHLHRSGKRNILLKKNNPVFSMRKSKFAMIQLHCSKDSVENQKKALHFAGNAADSGAKFIVLPELYLSMFSRNDMLKESTTIPGPITEQWSAFAKEHSVWLLAGSVLEASDNPERVYNTSILFDDSGNIVGKYRKIHLFDVDIPGGVTVQESSIYKPGKTPFYYPTPFGKIGVGICYDLRFPELFRIYARNKVDVILLPSAFSYYTGERHWKTLLKARAIENQCYIVAPNLVGESPNGVRSYGHSMIVNPWGAVVSEANDMEEGFITGILDRDVTKEYRRQMPALDHMVIHSLIEKK